MSHDNGGIDIHSRRRTIRRAAAVCLGVIAACGLAYTAASSSGAPASGRAEITFDVDESALLDLARAATPYTVTVGSDLLSVDLVFTEPSGLVLDDDRATLNIRVRGSKIPLDQILRPMVTVEYDAAKRQYFAIVSSLTVKVPGLGRIDLSNVLPRVAIPAVLENLWDMQDRPIGVRFHIRRIALRDHRLEVGADVDFAPITRSGVRNDR